LEERELLWSDRVDTPFLEDPMAETFFHIAASLFQNTLDAALASSSSNQLLLKPAAQTLINVSNPWNFHEA